MVTLVKHEWHQVDSQFAFELDADKLSEIYPDLNEDELEAKLQEISEGDISVEEIIEDALNEGVEIEWDRQYDDWWTERKGGYEVTFEVGDESSWHSEPEPTPHSHKCTKCKWTGASYDAEWQWTDKDGNEYDEAKHVCPMCESDIELTPEGVVAENEQKKRLAEIEAMFAEDDE